MKTYSANDYGIIPNKQIAKPLYDLFCELQKTDEEKVLVFEKGTYFIDSDECQKTYRAITNTTSAEEYKRYDNKSETFIHKVALLVENIKNLTIEGNECTFLIDGKVTNAIISNCENVRFKDFTIDTVKPNLHKLTVTKCTPWYAEFELDKESVYVKDKKGFKWVGKGYELGFRQFSNTAYWNATIRPEQKNKIERKPHPFRASYSVKEIAPYKFAVKYFLKNDYVVGQNFYVFNTHRSDVGIFAENSKNLYFENVNEYFNYSHAFVAQNCCDLTFNGCKFCPNPDGLYEMSSLTDFMHICMCYGKVTVENCLFDGAADDALNVHGIHFKVKSVNENEIIVAFCHPQAWDFNPLDKGDKIEFIDPTTLLCKGENRIVLSEKVDSHHIKLVLEKPASSSFKGLVIEDVDKCASLYYANNVLNHIITRGILYTSRGKAVIENNRFISNTMSEVLLSDDAKSWYESGMCKDVTIQNNVFEYSGATPILIKPENTFHGGAVHKNIKILNNVFKEYDKEPISIKSSSDVYIDGNIFEKSNKVEMKNCENIVIK